MFMNLFRVKQNLSNSNDLSSDTIIDTSQYDERESRTHSMLPEQGANLLLRTDDEVDFETAWNVIRDMMDNERYKSDVLHAIQNVSNA